ncbi:MULTISPECIES: hypothetical protein [unclassified Haladaptatus]|uniref:DUF5789 family protein n=1 Tax=unclassified Haladaptatus TaxID=2622732 RepID=UPI00209C298E|nr:MULTISPECIES: hypothetical protein [unclassified Haladaptatus]MCO8244429.1 hypothetical protein [Haladaptatus sp. AB643]MCO8253948.1 hypothetical protein [Haladaptatus sp. AB618]
MAQRVKYNRVETVFRELSYPIPRDDAAVELEETILVLAEGERNLGELIAETDQSEYESARDLEAEINNVLPREAVGEPYQSEGEG